MEDIRQGVCPLCRHDEILRSYPKGTGELFVEAGCDASQPPGVIEKQLRAGRSSDKVVKRGSLEIYVCRQCGYCQWFARDPGRIPFGDKAGLPGLIKGPEPGGPYR
jgi:hypothetical protein